jgi:tRNA 5-methylaminomethyl-2-thiouridine biosynthesis bifunctional protein
MKIIVIGAGLAGAATAHALAVRGCDVTVLEASGPCTLASPYVAGATAVTSPNDPLGVSSAPSAGLPVALLAPHQTQYKTHPPAERPSQHPQQHSAADDKAPSAPSPLTQLSHLGVAATLQATRSLLVQGQDWQLCGALQRAGKLGPQAHWFGNAAWVKPAALVAAWLAHPRIRLLTGTQVHGLRLTQLRNLGYKLGGNATASDFTAQKINVGDLSNLKNIAWHVLLEDGQLAAQAHAVVLANAYQAGALLAGLELTPPEPIELLAPPDVTPHPSGVALSTSNANATALVKALHQVAGQVICGPWTADWQALWPTLLPELAHHSPQFNHHTTPCAINGNGHFIPAVPWQGGHIWLSGSTYEHDTPHNPQVTAQGIASNLQRLQQLIPAAAHLLAAQHGASQVQGWAGTRCTTRDRLPMVGAVSADHAPGLYVCTAMGSRGLSFAALCGQHVAAQITQTSSPLPDLVRRAIDTARFF